MSVFFVNVKYDHEKALLDSVPHDSYKVNQAYVYPHCFIKFTKDNVETNYDVKADKHAYKRNKVNFDFKYDEDENIIPDSRDYFAYFVLQPFNDFDLYIIPVKEILKQIDDGIHKHIIQTPDKMYYVFDLDIYKKYKQNIA